MITLSEKEIRIIKLKSEGRTLKEIARELVTNRQYLKQQMNDIYKKTGCSNGPHLVAWAYQNNILPKVTC